MRSRRSISPTDCWDETRRLRIARRFGSAMMAKADCIRLEYTLQRIYLSRHIKRGRCPTKSPSQRSGTYGVCGTERRRTESNRRMEVLQTSALPLGYGAGG